MADRIVIDDDTPVEAGDVTAGPRGLVPRPPNQPVRATPFDPRAVPPIPRVEWPDRIADMKRNKSRLSDIIRGAGIQSKDQNDPKYARSREPRWGYCHPAGTLVRMADGTHKPIERIKLLDEVVSAEGNVRKVKQLHTRDDAREMCRLKLFGHGHLDLTPNHPVLTKRGYVEAADLKPGDMVAVPRYAARRHRTVLTAAHINARSRATVAASGTAYPNARLKPVPDIIELTEGFGRIVGLWVAEGHVDASVHEVVWSFNVTERGTLAAELVGLLESELGVAARIEDAPGTNGVQVKFRGKLWCELFTSLCGRLSWGKKLHADVMGGPLPFLRAVFDGWMDGDGCDKKDGGSYGATVSKSVALAMYDIANACGMAPAIRTSVPQVNRHAKTRRPLWVVSYVPDRGEDYRAELDDRATWRRVRGVETRAWNAPVFCLGVEVDNSFIAEGVAVHNCWMYGAVGAAEALQAVMNQLVVPLSAFGAAYTIKKGQDEGAWGALALDFLMDRGVPSEAIWPNFDTRASLNNADTWAEAATRKVTSAVVDLTAPVYNRDLTLDQKMTLLLLRCPVVCDYMWWGHCVYSCDPEDFDTSLPLTDVRRWGSTDRNSWGNSYGDFGFFQTRGQRSVPDNAVALLSVAAVAPAATAAIAA